ncbi:MAG: hypothetical protein OHK0046_45850 [Anaerolineae bacterium]
MTLGLLELILYAVLWAAIGGLPGFYLFASLNRNPRWGARIGILTAEIIGFAGLFTGFISTTQDAVNSTMLLWAGALFLGLVGNSLQFAAGVQPVGGPVQQLAGALNGNYRQQASLRQTTADLAYGLLLPTFMIVAAIVVFPMLWNLLLGFRPVRLADLRDLRLFALDDLTLQNFERVFTRRDGTLNRAFFDTLLRTLIYTVTGTLLAIFLGLVAALLVRDKFPGRNMVRGFMLFPYIAPIVSVVLVWKLLLNQQYGLINEINKILGMPTVDYLNTPGVAFTMVILFQGWRYFPFAALFILARLQAIPEDMYEAAKVDGAAPSQRLLYITLPQLRAVFGTLFLLRFIWTFNKFDDVYLLTGGAAQTKLVTIEIYDQLFSARNIGMASAVALVLAVVLIVTIAIYFRWFLVEEQ